MGSNSSALIQAGQSGLTPAKIIQTYSSYEWEIFISEWAEGFMPPYDKVVHLGGAGDKGRDIVGYLGNYKDPLVLWDNYQCKHYKNPLTPSDIYAELGKLAYYVFCGDFNTIPQKYVFVSPLGVGTKLHDLLKNPLKINLELIQNWEKYCKTEITKSQEIILEKDFLKFVKLFDFSILDYMNPSEILKQHEKTKYWSRRFQIAPPIRLTVTSNTPTAMQLHEQKYVSKLFDAYSDHLKCTIGTEQDLSRFPLIEQHFNRARRSFFTAESLAVFSRDNFAPDAFDRIKRHVYDGVIEVAHDVYSDGYERVKRVLQASTHLPLPNSELTPYVWTDDKKGICHHLANEDELDWVIP
jgi:hypothetical protein